jgi:carbonic anhydrase
MKTIIGFYLLIEINSLIKYYNGMDETTIWNCDQNILQSPIDIKFSTAENNIKVESIPKIEFLRTFYPPFNGKKLDENLEMDLSDLSLAKAYIKYHNISCKYIAKKLRVHIFSEHSFELGKYDIEIQVMHIYEKNDENCPLNLGISIFFSSQNNKKSKSINQFYKENKEENDILKKYSLTELLNVDLNQYVNFDNSYYYYFGSGTFPKDYNGNDSLFTCNDKVVWILFKKVHSISEKELNQFQLAIYNLYPNGNSRSIGPIGNRRTSENYQTYFVPK